MRKSMIGLLGALFLTFGAFGQKASSGENVLKAVRDCETCNEIIMVGDGYEKSYTRDWFDSMNLEDGFITFTRGLHKHYFNPNKVTFIEKNDRYVRIYLK